MILEILSSFRLGRCAGFFIELPTFSGLLRLNKRSLMLVLQVYAENTVRSLSSEVCNVRLLYASGTTFHLESFIRNYESSIHTVIPRDNNSVSISNFDYGISDDFACNGS